MSFTLPALIHEFPPTPVVMLACARCGKTFRRLCGDVTDVCPLCVRIRQEQAQESELREASLFTQNHRLREENRRLKGQNFRLRDREELCLKWQLHAAELLRENDELKRLMREAETP